MKPITEYQDYRRYMQEFYEEEKRNSAFTWREFARLSGFVSPTYLKLVCEGKTRLKNDGVDRTARAMGLPYPGGLHLDRLAQTGDNAAFRFPVPRVDGAPLDFSFSGLKTNVINQLHNALQKGETLKKEDLGASFLAAVVKILCDHTKQAALECGCKTIVLAGGVSANSVLRSEMQRLCDKQRWRLFLPDLPLCGDNAAMIGAQAYYEYNAGKRADLSLNAFATRPIEA